jgi:hypothetical protein
MTQRGWQGTGAVPAAEYDYPRRLGAGELAAAGAAGVVVGLAAFYVARVLAARTPLNEPAPPGAVPDGALVSSRAEAAALTAPDATRTRPARRRG